MRVQPWGPIWECSASAGRPSASTAKGWPEPRHDGNGKAREELRVWVLLLRG
jgi:hypothetical protein